jgi:hypothetical protein
MLVSQVKGAGKLDEARFFPLLLQALGEALK